MNVDSFSRIRAWHAVLKFLVIPAGMAAFNAHGDAGAHETPAQLVDALHSAFGVHHARAVHAKGVLLEGTFTPAADAKTLSQVVLFSGSTVPVTLRFSDFTGIRDIPDTSGGANPRGLAIKFRLADGTSMDAVTHSFNGFPTSNSDEFAQLLRAIGKSGPDAPKPTPIDQFLASHPVAKTFLTTQKPAPVSWATLSYFGVNAFKFNNAQGKSNFVRDRFVPVNGEQLLSEAALKSMGPNYLREEIETRIAKGPILYNWFAQIAAPDDVIADPSIAWPENRRLIKLGTIKIERMVADQVAADMATLFLPSNVPAGIEPADPMLTLRSAAYPISFGERQ